MKKRILYLATRFPYPATGGRERMILDSLEMLRDQYEVYLVYFGPKVDNGREQYLGVNVLGNLQTARPIEVVHNLYSLFPRSLQECLFYSRKASQAVVRFIQEVRPDLIIADMIRCAQYIEDTDVKKIVEMDDLLSVRYRRALMQKKNGTSILGTFEWIMPKAISSFISGPLRSHILKLEAKLISKREVDVARKFDAVTLVSSMEAALLRSVVERKAIVDIPPTVLIGDALRRPDPNPVKILFIGNLNTSQNLTSLEYVLNEILPLLDNESLEYEYQVVGAHDQRASRMVEGHSKVRLLGFVNALDDVIERASILLSPITFGTGIKTKILDAMARGLPVVTNSVGAEGIMVRNYKEMIIEDNPLLLRDAVLSLVRDPAMAKEMGENARKFVRRGYLREKVRDKYLTLINSVLEGRTESLIGLEKGVTQNI